MRGDNQDPTHFHNKRQVKFGSSHDCITRRCYSSTHNASHYNFCFKFSLISPWAPYRDKLDCRSSGKLKFLTRFSNILDLVTYATALEYVRTLLSLSHDTPHLNSIGLHWVGGDD